MVAIPQQQQPPAINGKALAWTVGIHALLFLLFFLIYWVIQPVPIVPISPVDTGGLEINLGTSDEGSGHSQPMSTKAPAPYHATVEFRSAPEKSVIAKDIVQTKANDAPELNTSNNTKKNKPAPIIEPKPTPKPPKVVEKPKYSYPGDNGMGGNNAVENKRGTSEGNGSGPGDKGVPGGTPGAAAYSGSPGNGMGGIGHTLSSREIYPRSFIAEFSESGTVTIHVTIDRNGNIITKNVVSSSSPELTKLALEKLRNVHYSPSTDANPQDFDNITIRFQTHQ